MRLILFQLYYGAALAEALVNIAKKGYCLCREALSRKKRSECAKGDEVVNAKV